MVNISLDVAVRVLRIDKQVDLEIRTRQRTKRTKSYEIWCIQCKKRTGMSLLVCRKEVWKFVLFSERKAINGTKFGIKCRKRAIVVNFGIEMTLSVQHLDKGVGLENTIQGEKSAHFGVQCRNRTEIMNMGFMNFKSGTKFDMEYGRRPGNVHILTRIDANSNCFVKDICFKIRSTE